jgi:hypothetical protein
MADSTETTKPKRTLTPEQIAKMQAAKKAKKAEREAAAAAASTTEAKPAEEKPKKGKKSKKETEETAEEKPKKTSWWDKLTPEQREERLAKMKAGKEAKKTAKPVQLLTHQQREELLDEYDDDVLDGTTDAELIATKNRRAGRIVRPMPKY